jgi:hypothetical protein
MQGAPETLAKAVVLAALRGKDVSYVTPKAPVQVPTFWTRMIDWLR